MSRKWGMFFTLTVFLSACTTLPSGPNVMVLPGVGKPFDQFQVDDVVCRNYAQGQAGMNPGQAGTQNTVQGAAIGTLVGAGIGAAIGAATGSPEVGAAIGAGTGLLMGTVAGAESGAATAGTLQWRYDLAYVQCMQAKDNQVPGSAAPSRFVPPPPNAPPPPGTVPPPPPR